MRRTADQLNHAAVQEGNGISARAGEHILICLSSAPSNTRVIRTAARMAEAFHSGFTALFVQTPETKELSGENLSRLRSNLHLAEQLGAQIATVYGTDPAVQIAEYARVSGVTKIVMGRINHKQAFPFGKKSLADRLIEFTVYILGVLLTAVWTSGYFYGALASFLSVAAFNFFFTEPRFSFQTDDSSYPVTFLIMLFSSIMANSLATRVKEQARLAVEKSYYTELLLESSQKLQQSQAELDCLRMTAEQLSRLFDRPVLYALSRGDAELSFRAEPPEASPLLSQLGLEELGVAKWVQKNNRHAGATTHTLPDSKWLFLSVRGTRGVMGIVGVPIAGYRIPDAFEKNLMIAILSQCGLSQERIRLQDAHASAAPPS